MSNVQGVSSAIAAFKVEAISDNVPPSAKSVAVSIDGATEPNVSVNSSQSFAASALQLQGDLRRFDLAQQFEQVAALPVPPEDAAPVGGTAPVTFVERYPAAQGLQFSETKGACELAYTARTGEIYRFPDGKQWKVAEVVRDPDTGFRAVVLKPVDPQDKRVIVAYAGSGDSKDWSTNINQSRNKTPAQYRQAVDLARRYQDKYGDNVILTGHSLGGGLASYAALQTGLRATAVNAAPLSPKNLGGNPMFNRGVTRKDHITQYYVRGEWLTNYDKITLREARPGNTIEVPGKFHPLRPGSSIQNHLIENVAPDVPMPVLVPPPPKEPSPIKIPKLPIG